MSADMSDIMAKLQMQLAQQNNNPSMAGLQAPTDPTYLANTLKQLKQQQYLQGIQSQSGGPYGWLTQGARNGMAQTGIGLANLANGPQGGTQAPSPQPQIIPAQGGTPQVGGDSSGPPPGGAPSQAPQAPQVQPGANPIQTMNNYIRAGRQIQANAIANGSDAQTAQIAGLKFLATSGIPGAADELIKAQDAQEKSAQTKAGTSKDNAQAANFSNESTNRDATTARDNAMNTFGPLQVQDGGNRAIQTNGLGKADSIELKPQPNASMTAANQLSPNAIQFASDTYRTTGSFPAGMSRSPMVMARVLNQAAQDADANGDTPGSIKARSAATAAAKVALDATQKQQAGTQAATGTLERNITSLEALGKNMPTTDAPMLNRIVNDFNQKVTTNPQTAGYVAMLGAVQGEYAKLRSNSLGNGVTSDSQMGDAKEIINKAMSQGGVAGVAAAMREEAANRNAALEDTRQNLLGIAGVNAPGTKKPASGAVDMGNGWSVVQK